MFTLFIHCLEVLAKKAEGQTVKTIVDMGTGLTSQRVHSVLQSLMDEGYVMCDDSGKVNVWTITEKACEYCERIAHLYAQSHVMDEIADYVQSLPQDGIAPAQETITDISETPQGVNIVSTTFDMPLYGNLTIAEVVEVVEENYQAAVVKAELNDGTVTLTIEHHVEADDLDEIEECYDCGGTCNYHMDWCPHNYA
jgi:predicted transcriptional regulator